MGLVSTVMESTCRFLGIKPKAQSAEPIKIPKTVQESIPYLGAFESGIIQNDLRTYSKMYALPEINFVIESYDEQKKIFGRFMEFLGSFGPEVQIQMLVYNKSISSAEFEQKILLEMKNDKLNSFREEMNNMLIEKMAESRNNIVHEKYIVISTEADDIETAKNTFSRLDAEVSKCIQRLTGGIESKPMGIIERLSILYSVYNMDSDVPFYQHIKMKNGKVTESFNLKQLKKWGITTKDVIAPPAITYNYDYFKLGDTYGRVLFLTDLPSFLRGDVVTELANMPFNMLTSVQYRSLPQEIALKKVKDQNTNVTSNVIEQQKKAYRKGYSAEFISPELKNNQKELEDLITDLTQDNQKLFMTTFTLCIFAESKEQLDKNTKIVQATAERFICQAKKLSGLQELGFNTCLPLAKNCLKIERMLNTRAAAIFIPFSVKELMQENGRYYGLNAVSKQLILCDRLNGKAGNGCIFGTTGSGKSFAAKREIVNVLLSTDDDVFIIDPEGEYSLLAEGFLGTVVRIAPGSGVYINPMDINLENYDSDQGDIDAITFKADFISSICEAAAGSRFQITPNQKSILDRCVKNVYDAYIDELKTNTDKTAKELMPTLKDLYLELKRQPQPEAQNLALTLERFAVGTQDSFSHMTNINSSNRFTIYNIKDIGNGMKTMGLQICLDNIWNKMIDNYQKGRRTWLYCDEFHLLLLTENSAKYTQQIWKRARKWNGVPTGITQQIEDMLRSPEGRTIISNSDFLLLLNQDPFSRMQLQQMLGISNTELDYITNVGSGQGLIYNGKDIIPFIDDFPKDTELYRIMTTKPDDIVHSFDSKA